MEPMVSVVIPTYKRSEMLPRAIKSVLSQTYKNVQVVVVDDNNPDSEYRIRTKEIVHQFDGDLRVKYVLHEKNMNGSVARNTGIRNADGEIVAFLDDDDVWKPEKIQKQLEAFDSEKIALVYCNYEIYNETASKISNPNIPFIKGNVFDELMRNNFIGSTSFPLLRKSVVDDLGGFDVLLESSQDYDMWIRMARNYYVNYVDEVLVTYYVHGENQITKSYKKRISGHERIIEKNINYYKSHTKAYCETHRKLLCEYAGDGRYFDALKLCGKVFLKSPFSILSNIKCSLSIIKLIIKNTIRR